MRHAISKLGDMLNTCNSAHVGELFLIGHRSAVDPFNISVGGSEIESSSLYFNGSWLEQLRQEAVRAEGNFLGFRPSFRPQNHWSAGAGTTLVSKGHSSSGIIGQESPYVIA